MSLADRVAAWLPILWFVLALVALIFLWMSGILPNLLRRLTKVGGFGVEFEFSEATARQTRETVESQLGTVRDTIRRELEADVRARSLQFGLQALLESSSLGRTDDYRATIHIPDPLLNNSLFQLLDYFPVGEGHGRTFSARAGLIGRVWRTGEMDEWNSATGISAEVLIKDWGMTQREAARRRVVDKTKVMVAFPLHNQSRSAQVGVLYLDSENRDRFGLNEAKRTEFMTELDDIYEEKLAISLSELVEAVMRRSPQLLVDGA